MNLSTAMAPLSRRIARMDMERVFVREKKRKRAATSAENLCELAVATRCGER